jgi:UDP-N-acetylglucosamine 3-dehydrogenase
MVDVGVVGLGAMGQHHARIYSELSHLGVLNSNEKLEPQTSTASTTGRSTTALKTGSSNRRKTLSNQITLVGVADAYPERAKEIGEKFQVPYYSDYRYLLDKVDAVSIAVPTVLHHDVALDFIKAGVHCLVEKPISFTLEEANHMIESAQRNEVNLAVGHIERFNPAVVKLKEIIDQGILGKLLIISTRRVGPFVTRIRDVGVVIDSATHDIGVAKYLLNKDPISVFSRVGSVKHPKDDHAIIVLDFGDTTACIEVNWFSPQKIRTLVATGSDGTAYLDYIEQSLTVHTCSRTEVVQIQKGEPLKLELEDFLDSIAGLKNPAVDGEEGQKILRIALKTGQSVSVGRQKVPSGLHRTEKSYSTRSELSLYP